MIARWEVLAYDARHPPGRGYVLRVHDDAGGTGLGEARAIEGFGSGPALLQEFIADRGALQALIDGLEARAGPPPFGVPVEALFAAETALADLAAQTQGVSLAEYLGAAPSSMLCNSLLVSNAARARALLQDGHRNFKLKARGMDPSCLDLLAQLFDASGGEASIRVDANGSWDRSHARDFLEQAPTDAIGFLEQPFAVGDLDSCRWLQDEFGIPVALDEGADSVAAVEAAARAGVAGVVIKPMYRGLRGALDLASAAADRGLGVCVTHAMDATVGRLAAMQVAAAADTLCAAAAWPHGLYAPGLTSVADEPVLRPDRLDLPQGAGLGCTGLRHEVLDTVSTGP